MAEGKSSLIAHAERELDLIGYNPEMPDGIDRLAYESIMGLMRYFCRSECSAAGAIHVISIFNKLARYEHLTPLTGEDWEWFEYELGQYQNIRCHDVFKKDKNGKAWNNRGIIWEDENGATYTNRASRVEIVFPYTPKSIVKKRRVE